MERKTDTNEARCPSLEEAAAFLDGRLTDSERQKLVKHASGCEACAALLAETARQLESEGAAVRVSSFPARRGALAVAVAVGIAAVVAVAVLLPRRNGREPDRAALIDALEGQRPFEPRLTGGFPFGPMRPVMRSASPESRPYKLLAAAAKLKETADAQESAGTLSSLGAAQLVLGESDSAVKTLEEANLLDPKNARILTDLAAAYLVHAEEKDHPEEIPRALEAAEKATELDPKLLEAWFDRAFALEVLALKNEAAKAWRDYLKLDAKSAWADEARKRLAAIEAIPGHAEEWHKAKAKMLVAAKAGDAKAVRDLMPGYCEETREWLEEELLPEWSGHELAGADANAAETMRISEVLALAQAEVSGDRMLRDTLEAIRRATVGGKSESLVMLAQGHRLYAEARRLYEKGDTDSAQHVFNQASATLSRGGSPYAEWANFYGAIADYYHAGTPALAERFRAQGDQAKDNGYAYLEARTRWMCGLIEGGNGALIDEIEEYRSALAGFSSTREITGSAAIYGRLSGPLFELGDSGSAWKALQAGFECLNRSSNKHRWANAMGVTAPLIASEGMPRVALHVASTTLDGTSSQLERAFLYSTRVSIDLQNRWWKEAEDDLKREELAISTLPAGGEREQLQALGSARASAVEVSRHPAEAAERLTRSISYYQAARLGSELPELYLWRGRALLGIGHVDAAESDFVAGLKEIETLRSEERGYEISYLEHGWELVSELVRFEAVTQRRLDLALDFLERDRALSVLGKRTPMRAVEIQRNLPPGTALVYYFIRDPELYSWLVTPSTTFLVRQRLSADDIQSLVRTFRNRLERASPVEQIRSSSARLYDVLIRPLDGRVSGNTPLVFIPDGVLNDVPFAALLDRRANRYLAENHVVTIAPSGTIWARSTARLNLNTDPVRSILAVSSPRAEGPGAENLPTLLAADDEAKEIAAIYPRATLLIGRQATKSRFLQLSGQADVVQFSGHALSDGKNPNLSRLYFAAGSGSSEDGILFGQDLNGRLFPRTRLMALAACSTATGIATHSEGPLSLAHGFLASGIPQVIATLWPTNDERSGDLLVRFHKAFARGDSAGAALRQAQLALLNGKDPSVRSPAIWAAYELIGGGNSRKGAEVDERAF